MSDDYKDSNDRKPGTVTVFHAGYGCDTGCLGHRVEYDGGSKFVFDAPYPGDDPLEWAQKLVREVFGEEHVKDLDWENCWVVEDL